MYMALFQPKAGLLLGAAVLLGLALLLPTAAQVVPPPAGPGVLAARQLRQSAPRALSSHCLVTFYRHLQPGMPKKLGKEHICAGCRCAPCTAWINGSARVCLTQRAQCQLNLTQLNKLTSSSHLYESKNRSLCFILGRI
jgi:hypothetical protein